jgi:hypothetical protein
MSVQRFATENTKFRTDEPLDPSLAFGGTDKMCAVFVWHGRVCRGSLVANRI